MKTHYRETQYFHLLFYAGSGGVGVILLTIAIVDLLAGGPGDQPAIGSRQARPER